MGDAGPPGSKRARMAANRLAHSFRLAGNSLPDDRTDLPAPPIALTPYPYGQSPLIDNSFSHPPAHLHPQYTDHDLGSDIPDPADQDCDTPVQSPPLDQNPHSLRSAFAHDTKFTDGVYPPIHPAFAATPLGQPFPDHARPCTPIPLAKSEPQQSTPKAPRPLSTSSTAGNDRKYAAMKKPGRAQLACENCRSRKSKCNEGKPTCSYCEQNNLDCAYPDPQPTKTGRAQKEISELAGAIKLLTDLSQDGLARLTRIERATSVLSSATSFRSTSTVGTVESPRRSSTPVDDDDSVTDYDDCPPFSSEKFVNDHSIGVYNLFKWPSVHNLLQSEDVKKAIGGRELDENFVMRAELQKGRLPVSGRSKADFFDGVFVANTQSNTQSDSQSNTQMHLQPEPSVASPAIPENWGTRFPHPNNTQVEVQSIARDEDLGFDKETMNSLLKSYLKNMYILHPIIGRDSLRQVFDRACEKIHSDAPPSFYRTSVDTGYSKKRKFSVEGKEPSNKEPRLESCVSTAIVLLVMALGKVCQHKGFLAGPGPTNFKRSSESPGYNNRGRDTGSPKGSPPVEGVRHRSMPGFAYYAKAADILNNNHTGSDLASIQARLLASLYAGQLALTGQSWTWLYQACASCVLLFSMRERDWTTLKSTERKKQMLFAYWTCFQLEGDLLAEMDLVPSGLQRLTQGNREIPHPSFESEDNPCPKADADLENLVYYYSGQITLRRNLDTIQSLQYPPKATPDRRSYEKLLRARNESNETLVSWRCMFVSNNPLSWNDKDPPANDINDARLRAKYWGSMYVINRPLLFYALHCLSDDEVDEWHLSDKENPPQNKQLWDICRQCLTAAKRSTEAFDKIIFKNGKPTNRLIVTNVFGTAHAQFGNMLVMAATYKSHLRPLVKKETLVRLLNRTIDFLTALSPLSLTLETDALVLRGLLGAIDRHQPYSSSPSSVEWQMVNVNE